MGSELKHWKGATPAKGDRFIDVMAPFHEHWAEQLPRLTAKSLRLNKAWAAPPPAGARACPRLRTRLHLRLNPRELSVERELARGQGQGQGQGQGRLAVRRCVRLIALCPALCPCVPRPTPCVPCAQAFEALFVSFGLNAKDAADGKHVEALWVGAAAQAGSPCSPDGLMRSRCLLCRARWPRA